MNGGDCDCPGLENNSGMTVLQARVISLRRDQAVVGHGRGVADGDTDDGGAIGHGHPIRRCDLGGALEDVVSPLRAWLKEAAVERRSAESTAARAPELAQVVVLERRSRT